MLACARLGRDPLGGVRWLQRRRLRVSGWATPRARSSSRWTGYYRGGELIDHKVKADEAIEAARKEGIEVEKVLVWRRVPGEYHSESQMVEGRDFFIDELLPDY